MSDAEESNIGQGLCFERVGMVIETGRQDGIDRDEIEIFGSLVK